MKRLISKQIILRALLLGFAMYLWFGIVPDKVCKAANLFCYTRDEMGNKALMKDNGAVYVEDAFIMEIPIEEFMTLERTTVTVILEDESGNQKKKTIILNPKKKTE